MTAGKLQRCKVEGCKGPASRVGTQLCEMHYYRLRRKGTVERSLPGPRPNLLHDHGYILVHAPDHPLAQQLTTSRVYQHRVTYYDAYGVGPFSCHWCGGAVGWSDMHVDHLNDVKSDNAIENLVAACAPCNLKRGLPQLKRAMRSNRAKLIHFDGISLTAGEWAIRIGISRQSLLARIRHGWPLARAITEGRGRFGPESTCHDSFKQSEERAGHL